jgi:hypothetical protein
MKSLFKPIGLITALLAAAWLLHAPVFRAVGRQAEARAGAKILAAGQGKVENAAAFVEHRLVEALVLATVIWGLTLAVAWAARRARALPPFQRWLAMSLAGFAGLNLLLACAGRTVLFWVLIMQGTGVQNLAQFEIKGLLLSETSTRPRVALLGSSQVRAQVDEEQLNGHLAGRARAFELHFPGSRAADLLTVWREIRGARPEITAIYVSEATFYTGGESPTAMVFHGLSDWPDRIATGGGWIPSRSEAYGTLGSVLPVFRMRDALGQRVLGNRLFNLEQERGQAAITSDLGRRAVKVAGDYRSGTEAETNYRALDRLLGQCRRDGARVLLVAGQLNPVLEGRLPAGMRAQMLARLEAMVARHPGVTLWHPDRQTPTDYDDLTHANRETALRFTSALAGRLVETGLVSP